MTCLLDLPNEVILEILRNLSQPVYKSLCLVNRRISGLSTPLLYSNIFLNNYQYNVRPWNDESWMDQHQTLRSFTFLMLRRPDLADHVKRIEFFWYFSTTRYVPQWRERMEYLEEKATKLRIAGYAENNTGALDPSLDLQQEAVKSYFGSDALEDEMVKLFEREAPSESAKAYWRANLLQGSFEEALIALMLPALPRLESLDITVPPDDAITWNMMLKRLIEPDTPLFNNLKVLTLSKADKAAYKYERRRKSAYQSLDTLFPWFHLPSLREIHADTFWIHDITTLEYFTSGALSAPVSSNVEVLDIMSSEIASDILAVIISLPKALRIFRYHRYAALIRSSIEEYSVPLIQEALVKHESSLEELTLDFGPAGCDRELELGGYSRLKRLRCSGELLCRNFSKEVIEVEDLIFQPGEFPYHFSELPASLEELVVTFSTFKRSLAHWTGLLALASSFRKHKLENLKRLVVAELHLENGEEFSHDITRCLSSLKDTAKDLDRDIDIELIIKRRSSGGIVKRHKPSWKWDTNGVMEIGESKMDPSAWIDVSGWVDESRRQEH